MSLINIKESRIARFVLMALAAVMLVISVVAVVTINNNKKEEAIYDSKLKSSGKLKDIASLQPGEGTPVCSKLDNSAINSIFKEQVSYKKGLSGGQSSNVKTSSCIVLPQQKEQSKMVTLLLREFDTSEKANQVFDNIYSSVKRSESIELDLKIKNILNIETNQLSIISGNNIYTLTVSGFDNPQAAINSLAQSIQ